MHGQSAQSRQPPCHHHQTRKRHRAIAARTGTDGESGFEVLACGDIVQHKKLAPDIYFWVLEKIGLSATDCIALEDSKNGLRSSLAAGVKTFMTVNHYTRSQNFAGAAGVFDDLSNLDDFYRRSGLPLPKQRVSV